MNRNTRGTGFDFLTIQQVEASGVENFIRSIKTELKSEKYASGEVKRVKIPKKNRETRQLGILTLKDRLVQGAVKLILEPIFEADFEN
ncbi:Retron-type RNA-directed DNA polymerase [Methanosarcina barkeri 227]|uniref:Retron-type RNA-directed DNA polymerase n=1 Tax=Methanosarcina barkeri 227 TaxID=1434106 RepID=A0A0E3R5C3_METBA|nr:Retron-type RNA-directed DNA polymerase [Methanosarcina barkeri 227]